MKELKHFSYFQELLEKPKNELVEEAIAEGRIPVGYTCSYVPTPLLMVDKLFPVRLRAPELEDVEHATYYLSQLLCSYSRNILQAALEGEYDFLKAMIGTTACSHMCASVEVSDWKSVVRSKGIIYPVIDTPKQKNFDPSIEAEVYQYTNKLFEPLDEMYGIDYSDSSIKKAVQEFNEFTELMRKISDLRKEENPKISGTEYHVIYLVTQIVPIDKIMDKLRETYEEILARKESYDFKAKVMILGSELDDPSFTKLVEEQGALVVADRYCTGSLPGIEKVVIGDRPLFDLLNFWMCERRCPKIIDDTRNRTDYSEKLMDDFNVDGVIYQKMKFCEHWAYEGVTMTDIFKKKGIANVIIEKEYSMTSIGQIRTRVQAFIESLDIKRINKLNKEIKGIKGIKSSKEDKYA